MFLEMYLVKVTTKSLVIVHLVNVLLRISTGGHQSLYQLAIGDGGVHTEPFAVPSQSHIKNAFIFTPNVSYSVHLMCFWSVGGNGGKIKTHAHWKNMQTDTETCSNGDRTSCCKELYNICHIC